MFLVAPDGRLLSPRWRLAVLAGVVGSSCFAIALLLVPPTSSTCWASPRSTRSTAARPGPCFICFLLLMVSTLVAAAVSMVIRFRRAEGELRQQLWCFALSAVPLAGGVAWLLAVRGPIEDPRSWIAALPLSVAYFLLPILTGTAVLRYRLYTSTSSSTAPSAGAGYGVRCGRLCRRGRRGVLVMGTQAGNLWLSLLALALVALAFHRCAAG